jgi:uncharacterized protein (TIGR03437 family)
MGRAGLIVLFISALAMARQPEPGCSTTGETAAERLFLHRQAQRAHAGRTAPLSPSLPVTDHDIGNIAIIDDSGGVIERLNQFNLDRTTLTFTPSAANAARYRYALSGASFDSAAAAQGSPLAALGDDDWRELTLPFSFPFFGATYSKIYLNSDGNLTFTAPESASSSRTTGRMTGGPPRIAPLFDDLDPSGTPGSVRYAADATRAVFTWSAVPEYSDSGSGFTFDLVVVQTFQVRLYPDGRIQFAYNGVIPASAVVGIAPGNAAGATNLVSFHNDPSAEYSSAVVEHFGNTLDIDIVMVAQRFYQTHEDAYDYLVIYNNMQIAAMPGAIAYEATVRSSSTGHGVPVQDAGAEYGSPSRLRAVLNLGNLDQYPLDTTGLVRGRESQHDTPLTILGHEAGHLFNSFASVRDPNDPNSKPMLGFGGAHWSFLFDSEASLDEGEQILDRGAGASPRFVTAAITQGYSPLDQYLMGFRAPADVPPTFVITGTNLSPLGHPLTGVPLAGSRLDVRVDDVIAAEGRRTPDDTVAQRRYRFAFIIIAPQGMSPTDAQIEQVETYRQQFPAFFASAASNNASADMSLGRSMKLSLFPAAGVMTGGTAAATVAVKTAPKSDLTIHLQAPAGHAQFPATVRIPAGATSATFALTGVSRGVEELVATPADAAYETAFARVQVDDGSLAKLVRVSDTVVRLTDINGLPYAGARLTAAASPGASVASAVMITDAQGQAAFQWTPAATGASQLTIAVEAAPAVSLTIPGGPAAPVVTSVVNAASLESGVAPGALQSLFGRNLTGGRVRLGALELPVSFSSDGQINFFVPFGPSPGPAMITVITPSGVSATAPITISDLMPGIFPGAILRAGTSVSASNTAVRAGDFIEIYCTGLGPTHSVGGLPATVSTPTVFIGGVPMAAVYSGAVQGSPGLYQVNARIPPGLTAGTAGIIVSSGSAHSNEVKILLQ